jgi:hypothetical protein
VAHVVQQMLGDGRAATSAGELESEADAAGHAIASGRCFAVARGAQAGQFYRPLLVSAGTELARINCTYAVIPAYPPVTTTPLTLLRATVELVPEGEVAGGFEGFTNHQDAFEFAEQHSRQVVAILQNGEGRYHAYETDRRGGGEYLLLHVRPIAHSEFRFVRLANISARPSPALAAALGRGVTIDALGMPSSNFTIDSDVEFANRVFSRCGIVFTVRRRIGPREMEPVPPGREGPRNWLGADLAMGWSRQCGSFHRDELSTYNGTRQRFSLDSRIQVYYVRRLDPPTNPAFSEYPDCAGREINMAVLANSHPRRSFAHEMGHILLNSRRHSGIDDPEDRSNLMRQTSEATGSNLDESQCRIILRNL